jgi:hypothetical protein
LYTFWDYKRKRWERDAGRHAVPARLAAVDGMISRLPDCFRRKLAVCDFEFLKAHDVGLGFAKPVQQVAQTTVMLLILKLAIFICTQKRTKRFRFQWKFRLFVLMMSMCKSGT